MRARHRIKSCTHTSRQGCEDLLMFATHGVSKWAEKSVHLNPLCLLTAVDPLAHWVWSITREWETNTVFKQQLSNY